MHYYTGDTYLFQYLFVVNFLLLIESNLTLKSRNSFVYKQCLL
jgi:hypothetical protein